MAFEFMKNESLFGEEVEWVKALVLKTNLGCSYISSLEDKLSYSYELVTKKINTI